MASLRHAKPRSAKATASSPLFAMMARVFSKAGFHGQDEADFGASCARLSRATGANVAMMFGLSLVPLAIAAGAGLDFAHAMMVRNDMADALDAAALAVGAAAPALSSPARRQSAGAKYFQRQFQRHRHRPRSTPVINGQSGERDGQRSVATTLLVVVGKPPISMSSVSTVVVWGQTKLWVSLVLDNTGSMSQTELHRHQQDHGAEKRVAQSAHHPAECVGQCRRRRGRDRAVRQGRQCRHQSMSAPAGSTGPIGSTPMMAARRRASCRPGQYLSLAATAACRNRAAPQRQQYSVQRNL